MGIDISLCIQQLLTLGQSKCLFDFVLNNAKAGYGQVVRRLMNAPHQPHEKEKRVMY